jgi:selenocysteine lyase/cysteine desulfurase
MAADADRSELIYLDYAATSWPKAVGVAEAMAEALAAAGSAGRGAHTLAEAGAALIARLRARLARLVNLPEAGALALLPSCTDAANAVIRSVAERAAPGRDRAVCSAFEHNAVARPLHVFAERGLVHLDIASPAAAGATLVADDVLDLCDERTALVCVTHASNVTGAVQPIGRIAAGLRERAPEAVLLVDAAQTVGRIPFDMRALGADAVTFGSHKHLLGPPGLGGLALGPRLAAPGSPHAVSPLVFGGTGSSDDVLEMPSAPPASLEAGTANVPAAAGLLAALEGVDAAAIAARATHEHELTERLLAGLRELPGVGVHGPVAGAVAGDDDGLPGRIGVVAFDVPGFAPQDVAAGLDASFGIAVRAGLQCAPLAHRHLGTTPAGLVRASVGPGTTSEHIDALLAGVATLVAMPSVR